MSLIYRRCVYLPATVLIDSNEQDGSQYIESAWSWLSGWLFCIILNGIVTEKIVINSALENILNQALKLESDSWVWWDSITNSQIRSISCTLSFTSFNKDRNSVSTMLRMRVKCNILSRISAPQHYQSCQCFLFKINNIYLIHRTCLSFLASVITRRLWILLFMEELELRRWAMSKCRW